MAPRGAGYQFDLHFLRVLNLSRQGFSFQSVLERAMVTPTRHIFAKLGVRNRNELLTTLLARAL